MRPKSQRPTFDPEAHEAEWRARALGVRLSWSIRIRMGRTAPVIDRRLAEIEDARDRQEAERLGVVPRVLSGGRTSKAKHGSALTGEASQRRAYRAAVLFKRMVKRSQETLATTLLGAERQKSVAQDRP